MATYKLPRITDADVAHRGVLAPVTAPAIRGDGPDEWTCSGCDRVLVERAPMSIRMANGAVKCPGCGAVSDLDAEPGNVPGRRA